jgi:predicted secreted protein
MVIGTPKSGSCGTYFLASSSSDSLPSLAGIKTAAASAHKPDGF